MGGVGLDVEVSSSGGLEEFEEALRALASPAAMQDFYDEAGAACADLVRQGFAQSRAPNGTPWRPTKAGNPPLVRTGAMAGSVEHVVTGNGFQIIITDPKSVFHQRGTSRGIPARPMLPEGSLPPAYAAEIERVWREHFNNVLGS
jgi:hypothetical protein